MKKKIYRVQFSFSGRNDVKDMKRYILNTFKYRELGKSFTKKMKEAEKSLKIMPTSYNATGFQYRGYDIYLKPCHTYLFFYVVDEENQIVTVLRVLKDGMNWQFVIKHWLQCENE